MKKIFITGASGCIGHYLVENLIQDTDHELYLLVRNPEKLGFNYQARPGIHLLQGDLLQIANYADLLKTMNVAILIAAAWGGIEETREINVTKTHQLISFLDVELCEQVIYFSTASILDKNNQLLAAAGKTGHNYIRTKYECYQSLGELAIAPKITTVFPTLVFGGEEKKPYSHISGGIGEVAKYIDLIKWLKADASFHFLHARDIAQVVCYLVEYPELNQRQVVLGTPVISANQAVEEVTAYLHKKIYFRIPLSVWMANILIAVFRIEVADWDYFSIQYRHFTYKDPVTPASFGLPTYCATLADVLQASGIPRPLAN